ncbi:MAG: Gfo/Idh/MocA family oxidoreductase [Bacteroidales bacterium]
MKLHAVGSRSGARAQAFAREQGYEKWYGSYSELAADPDLDIVYVATPHSHHLEHTLLCLENGKHVICEKAFALNGREVKAMIEKAREKDLFLMEALWPPFQPSYVYATSLIDSGRLGEVVYINSHFAFLFPYESSNRLFNPDLGGGSLLDIGIYPVMDALSFMGRPSGVKAWAGFAPTGVDHTIQMVLDYGKGRFASLYSSVNTPSGIKTEIFCTRGKITLSRSRDLVQKCIVEPDGGPTEEKRFMPEGMGYNLEAEEVMNCIDRGKTQSSVVPWSYSRDLIEILDLARKEIGLVYPGGR